MLLASSVKTGRTPAWSSLEQGLQLWLNTLPTNLLDFMVAPQFLPSAPTPRALSSAECCESKSVLTPFHREEMELSGRPSPGSETPIPQCQGSHWKCGNGSEPLIQNKENRNLNVPNNNSNIYCRQQFPPGISSLLKNTKGNLSKGSDFRESAPFAGKKEK